MRKIVVSIFKSGSSQDCIADIFSFEFQFGTVAVKELKVKNTKELYRLFNKVLQVKGVQCRMGVEEVRR